MSAALKRPMTLEAFLDWESRQDIKYEFGGFQPVAMTGGTWNHGAIQANIIAALRSRLRGGPCRILGSDVKIQVAGSIRYPDAFVVCTSVQPDALVITDPVVVFEVLSESTSSTDRIEKNQEYRATPSIQRYVIVEQTKPAATLFTRAGEAWQAEILLGDATLALPEIGVTVPVSEFYEDVVFLTEAVAREVK